jgi:two-component system chemotaxis response regulator CheY
MAPLTPSGPHILLVEDSPAHRRAARFALASAGFRVSEATDGIRALNLAKNDVFDLVITDYYMTPVLGSEFVKELRQIERYAGTPVIMLTAFADELNSEYLRDNLLVLLLPKPCSMGYLRDMVSKLLAVTPVAG